MNKANNDDDYTSITNFYLYKICDSIIELDINERMKAERERVKESKELALLRENNNDRRITRR